MKRMIVAVIAVFVLSQVSLLAQDAPKAQFFGGFSVLSSSGNGTRTQHAGWQASLEKNLTNNLGLVADFGGQYRDLHAHEYLFGPRFNSRTEKATIFGHALFGGMNIGSNGVSANAFTMGYGGGVDLRTGDQMSVRLVQFDWLPSHMGGVWDKNMVRFGFGFVFGK